MSEDIYAEDEDREVEGIINYSLFQDALGGWLLEWRDSLTGFEEHRAASSEAVAKRFARDTLGVKRWQRGGGFKGRWVAEETYTVKRNELMYGTDKEDA